MIVKRKKYKVANKVVLGFLLAAILVIVVSVVTFFSIQKLLDTVEKLSEPNEELRQLNGLLADVYLLDMSKTERTSDKDSIFEATEKRVKERLDWLKENSEDSTKIKSFENISMDISELMVVYAGLEEVRYNLTNKTFSEEALKNIERRIKRQQELSEMQFLGRSRERDILSDLYNIQTSRPSESSNVYDLLEELENFQEEVEQSEASNESTGEALESLKSLMTKIYEDEQQFQQNFVTLESRLLQKNQQVFSQIQQLISSMQRELLIEYRTKNQSAYSLTYTVSIILGIMVFLGIIGSLGFVYSILNEVKKANSYREQLEEAKRNSDYLAKAKQDFLANMSHEIRNPLHAIQGYQEALRKTTHNPEQKEYVNMIGFASETLIAIVNDILDFSKLEAGKIKLEKRPFDPIQLFESLKSFFGLKAREKGLAFNWNVQIPEKKWVEGDQLRMNQILNNLLSNAFKFTQNGKVEVKVDYSESGWLILSVEDTGMGMSDDVLNNIFQEFDQGDTSITRQFGGTGLGLSITKKLVDLHNGEIEVNSQPEMGTKVTVRLPLSLVDPLDVIESSGVVENVRLDGIHILLVDDDSVGLKLLKLMLQSKGATVMDYLGGIGFMENFEFEQKVDLAVLDIQMPKLSGVQVLKMLREHPSYNSIPILAITANVFADEKNKLTSEGFDGLILKPFREEQVISKIHKLLDKLPEEGDNQDARSTSGKGISNKAYDLKDIHKFCMGDEEMLHEVIVDIIESTRKNVTELTKALKTNEFDRIREITHQLSSRMKQIRVKEGEDAKNIEVALKNGDTTDIEEKVNQLAQDLSVVMEQIERDFEQKQTI
jgi:signal transduction histidine kinase/FixJ family two-component response regulator/HPt (histidine-containing phosphotransfer) domain-containing protein